MKTRKIFNIVIMVIILTCLSACSFNDIKRFGLGIITGTPIEEEKNEEKSYFMVENNKNSVTIDAENAEAIFKYTVERAYAINTLSEQGLTKDIFPTKEKPPEYITDNGILTDENKCFLMVELSIEKLSQRINSFTGADDENIHILRSMHLFSGDYTNAVSEPYYGLYLEQTEDVSRSQESKEFNYFSLPEGDTAHFKICFIVDKDSLKNEISLFLGEYTTIIDGELRNNLYSVPLDW